MEMEAQQSENEEDASDFFSSYNDPALETGKLFILLKILVVK